MESANTKPQVSVLVVKIVDRCFPNHYYHWFILCMSTVKNIVRKTGTCKYLKERTPPGRCPTDEWYNEVAAPSSAGCSSIETQTAGTPPHISWNECEYPLKTDKKQILKTISHDFCWTEQYVHLLTVYPADQLLQRLHLVLDSRLGEGVVVLEGGPCYLTGTQTDDLQPESQACVLTCMPSSSLLMHQKLSASMFLWVSRGRAATSKFSTSSARMRTKEMKGFLYSSRIVKESANFQLDNLTVLIGLPKPDENSTSCCHHVATTRRRKWRRCRNTAR